MKKKTILNTVTSMASQLVAVIYGFVIPRLILEEFGSEVNGLTQSIKQFLMVISFLDLGVGQVVRSALYRPLSQKDRTKIGAVMASGRKFYRGLLKGLVVYVTILTVVYPMFAKQSFGWMYTASLIVAMSVSSFAQFYFSIINDQLLQADQRGYILYTSQIAANVLNAVLCVWLMRMGGSIQGVKLMTSMVFLLKALTIEIHVRRHYRLDRNIRYEGEPIKQKWNGVAQHVSAVVLDGTDTIVLTFLSTLSNVSVYSVYYMVVSSIQIFYQSAVAGIQSAAGMLWVGGEPKAQIRMFTTVELILHTVTVFLFCCTGLLIVPFIRVYTDGLTDAQYIQPLFASLLTFAYGIRCLRTPYNIWILAAGHYKHTQRCHITAATLNLAVSVLAVFRWGLVGVAIGTLVAMCYQTVWMALYTVRNLLRLRVLPLVKRFAVDFLTAGAVLVLCRDFAMHEISYLGWLMLAIKIGCTTLVVTGVMLTIFYRKLLVQLLRRNA